MRPDGKYIDKFKSIACEIITNNKNSTKFQGVFFIANIL